MSATLGTMMLGVIMSLFVLIAIATGTSNCRNSVKFDDSPIVFSISTGLQGAIALLIFLWQTTSLELCMNQWTKYLTYTSGLTGYTAKHLVMGVTYLTFTAMMAALVYCLRKMVVNLKSSF